MAIPESPCRQVAGPGFLGGLGGAVSTTGGDCRLERADANGVFPDRFYSTTNQRTEIRLGGKWLPVDDQEMDCGIVLDRRTARCVPMTEVRVGDLVAVGHDGLRVFPEERSRQSETFEFMGSAVSTEKPKGVAIRQIAQALADNRAAGGKTLLVGGPAYLVFLFYFGDSPRTTNVGYSPRQPIAFSHAIHAGQMGLDCRYCHTTVETAALAAIPATSICMNCHTAIGTDSEDLAPMRESIESGVPLRWVRVHDLPDFVYFDHSAHVTRGVGCVSCHGRIDTMKQVYQVETLGMGWCLDCHRDPAPHLGPREIVTYLGWAEDQGLDEEALREIGESIMQEQGIRPSTDCSTCHR